LATSPAASEHLALIRVIAVLGAGTMGHGIAQVAAAAGWPVRLYDINDDATARGRARIQQNLDGAVSRGKLDAAAAQETLARVTTTSDLRAAVADADLVVEAVPERMDLKRALFQEVAAAAPAHAILGTNTSSFSIDAIADAAALGHPDAPARVIGLHFFNPVHIMKLLEVVVGARTAPLTAQTALAFAVALDKQPIHVQDSPGFATSRLGIALAMEAIRMLEQGVASAADIDAAMELGYRHPMGPLRLTDLVGLDVRLDIARYLHQQLGGDMFKPPALLEDLVARGRLGKKTGGGFYDY
jgi:3-hydroxybutyryl-CoA dehydrogenase